MATMTVRMSEEDAELIRKYAAFTGSTISDFARSAMFEKIEDEQDLADLQAAMKADDGVRYSQDDERAGAELTYTVEYTARALKQLKKMDRFDASLIVRWVERNLQGTANPYAKGKGLTENRTREWRYRVGDYRILCFIHDDVLTIEIFSIGHRSNIYDR